MFKNTSNYRNKIILLSVIQVLLLLAVLVWSVITGQYPLTLKSLLSGEEQRQYICFLRSLLVQVNPMLLYHQEVLQPFYS